MMNTMTDRSPTARTLGYVAAFSLGLLALAALMIILGRGSTISGTEEDFLVLRQAEMLPMNVELQDLPRFEDQWTDVNFPFHWRNSLQDARVAWYRLSISAEALSSLLASNPGDQLLGLYVWRLNQTADFWINGSQIGSGGRIEPRMARHWNSPLYFSIPPGLIQAQNTLLVKHYAPHSWGSMEEIVIGQEDFLKPVYETRFFIQHDVSLGLFVFVLSTSIFTFVVWYFRRHETQYFWFSLGSFSLSFYILHQFLRYLPLDPDIWRWLSNISSDLWASCVFIFSLRSLNLHRPLAEKLVYGYLLCGVFVYFYASFFEAYELNIYFHVFTLIIGIYNFYLCVEQFSATQDPLPAFYACLIAILFAAGVHDISMQAIVNIGLFEGPALSFQNHFNFIHFFAPIIFIFIGASLLKRFVDSMNESTRLNAELEQRVADARAELESNYQAIEAVLVQQSAHEERERIYRDLHDDVGSKLLSLYYRLDNESDSTLARSALEDLRDIVSRKSIESCALADAVQQWRTETEERVRDANVALSWYAESFPPDMVLSELQHAHLRRMLREMLSNAIIHNKTATAINVSLFCTETELVIEVANDGVEKAVSEWVDGRGISNLRVRARDLQGELTIASTRKDWVKVSCQIPLHCIQQERS